jgi:hypothetical protein
MAINNNGKIRVLMLKGEKGDRGSYDDATQLEHGLMSAEDKTKLDNFSDNYVSYETQYASTEQRLTALGNCGLHVGRIPPENVTTDQVPVGELYLYLGQE